MDMIYCESYKFRKENYNLSNFGFSFKGNAKKINVIYSKNVQITSTFYESFWNDNLYTGSFFINEINLKNLSFEQRKDWFYKNVGFVDDNKLVNKNQTVFNLFLNTYELYNKKRSGINKYLRRFSLYKYRDKKIRDLNQKELMMVQLCLCLSLQSKYVVIKQNLFDHAYFYYREWFIKTLNDLLTQYSVNILCLANDPDNLQALSENKEFNLIDLDKPKFWRSNDSLTIYSYKFKEVGFQLKWRTFNGLANFLWKNIWTYWLPLIIFSLVLYCAGMFLLVFYSANKEIIINIFGYLLISLVALSVAVVTILSFFKLEKKMHYLRLLNINERYLGMMLPTNVFIVSISICLTSYLFNLFLFLGLYKVLYSSDWINTLYISTAFIIWCLVITVLVIISYEKGNNILKLIKSIQLKDLNYGKKI